MKQPDKSAHNRQQRTQGLTSKRFASTLPAQSLGILSSVSLLGGGFVFAQTESSTEIVVPTIETSQPQTVATQKTQKSAANTVETKSEPDFATRRAKLKQKLNSTKTAQTAEPKTTATATSQNSQPVVIIKTSQPQVEKSKIKQAQTPVKSTPQTSTPVAQPAQQSPATPKVTTTKTQDYNNTYIDPTEYKTKPTGAKPTGEYKPPTSVVVQERSTGCEAIFSKQEIAAGACGQKTQQTPSVAEAPQKSAPSWIKKSETASLKEKPTTPQATTSQATTTVKQTTSSKVATQPSPKTPQVVKAVAAAVNSNQSWNSRRTASHSKTTASSRRFIPKPSEFSPTTTVSATPIAPSFGTLPPPMAEGNVAPRPSQVSYDFALASVLPEVSYSSALAYSGGANVIFPLSVPSPVTSLFGWRIHPIHGDRRFHAGTDLGAPTGTPILAAARGQVETANWVGGYGLTVTVNHSSAQQTLYGHMSEILVRPGQWVEPGTVIGRVGSTGNSTGPHLHFEVRHLTPNGWVAVDPSVKLRAGLYNLLDNQRTVISKQ